MTILNPVLLLWYVDETSLHVNGKWCSLYRAIDEEFRITELPQFLSLLASSGVFHPQKQACLSPSLLFFSFSPFKKSVRERGPLGRLRQDFDQPLRIEQMARELGMSVSGLRYHFKAVTAMSPSQFQKQLRLQGARRLMLSEDLDAASAAYRVGYHDASHFNREYKSLFGVPPMRDVQRLREEAQDRAEIVVKR